MKGKKLVIISAFTAAAVLGALFTVDQFKGAKIKHDVRHALKTAYVVKGWIEFNGSEIFTVHFPKKPEASSRELPIPGSEEGLPYQEYKCNIRENSTISVSYTILPESWLNWGSGLVLRGSLKELMKELDNPTLVGSGTNTFKDNPSLDYEHYSGDIETAGTLVLVGRTLYKMEMTYPMAERDQVRAELNYFLSTFTPTPEQEEPTTDSSQ